MTRRWAATAAAYVLSWSLPAACRRVLGSVVGFLLGIMRDSPRQLLVDEPHDGGGVDDPTLSHSPSLLWRRGRGRGLGRGALQSPLGEDEVEVATLLSPRSGQLGLVNTGNTCFVNAVVQCLVAVPGLVNELERAIERVEETALGETKALQFELVVSLVELLRGLAVLDDLNALEVDVAAPTETARARSTATNNWRRQCLDVGERNRSGNTQRLRKFLDVASKCSDLIQNKAFRQEQQDAEEFLSFLMDSIHELTRNKRKPTTMELCELNKAEEDCGWLLKNCLVTDPATYNATVCHLSDVRWTRYLLENESPITSIFGGQIVRGSQCGSCATLTCLHQEFRVFSLSIPPTQQKQTIQGCLESYRYIEDLVEENRVFCDGHCKTKTNRRTQILVQRAPNVLVIQLQRFKHTAWQSSPEKVATAVQFPCGGEYLDITENMFMRDSVKRVRYELQAVCAHIGCSLDAGHYVAYARRSSQQPLTDPEPSESWLKFDDDEVIPLEEAAFRVETESTAYLLFYSKIPCETSTTEDTANVEASTVDLTLPPITTAGLRS